MNKKKGFSSKFKHIKNYHSIGKGGKQIKKEEGKTWVDAHQKAYGKTQEAPSKTTKQANPKKLALKSTTSLTSPKSLAFKRTVDVAKASPSRIRGLEKMKQNMAKSAPSSNITMQKRKEVTKVPKIKGRGR